MMHRSCPVIVKVQMPLSGYHGDPALVYDEWHSVYAHMPITDEVQRKMKGQSKAFFYARREACGFVQLGREAPWQDW